MDTTVIVVLLGSALLHASWNSIIKGGTNKLFEVTMNTTGAGLCAMCCLPFLPLPLSASWPFIIGSACIHQCYYTILGYSYARLDMSYAYTLTRGASPLITTLTAVFLVGESLNPGGWLGVILLSSGILTLALNNIFKSIFKLQPTLVALFNAVVVTGYTVVDGLGVRRAGDSVAYVCWIFFVTAFPIGIFVALKYKGEYFSYVRLHWRHGAIGGACGFIAYGLSVWAMAYAPLPLVAALRETSVIFGMIIAVLILKERFYPARALAVLLVCAGAASIKFLA